MLIWLGGADAPARGGQVLGTDELDAYLRKYGIELDPQLEALVGRHSRKPWGAGEPAPGDARGARLPGQAAALRPPGAAPGLAGRPAARSAGAGRSACLPPAASAQRGELQATSCEQSRAHLPAWRAALQQLPAGPVVCYRSCFRMLRTAICMERRK